MLLLRISLSEICVSGCEAMVSDFDHAIWCGFIMENFIIRLINAKGCGETFMLLSDASG